MQPRLSDRLLIPFISQCYVCISVNTGGHMYVHMLKLNCQCLKVIPHTRFGNELLDRSDFFIRCFLFDAGAYGMSKNISV